MTLLHEMMHLAGYDHPFLKSDPRYWDTVPLKAEKCIAGFASDAASPAIHVAHAEVNMDGTLGEKRKALPLDEAKKTSGCGLYDSSKIAAAEGEPGPSSESRADLSSHADAAPISASIRPYEHNSDKTEAIGLAALMKKVHA